MSSGTHIPSKYLELFTFEALPAKQDWPQLCTLVDPAEWTYYAMRAVIPTGAPHELPHTYFKMLRRLTSVNRRYHAQYEPANNDENSHLSLLQVRKEPSGFEYIVRTCGEHWNTPGKIMKQINAAVPALPSFTVKRLEALQLLNRLY